MYGVSDHDLMFSKEAAIAEEQHEGDHDNNYIENRVCETLAYRISFFLL